MSEIEMASSLPSSSSQNSFESLNFSRSTSMFKKEDEGFDFDSIKRGLPCEISPQFPLTGKGFGVKRGGSVNSSFSASCSDDSCAEDIAFDRLKCGADVELLQNQKSARRLLPIGGSRLVVGQLGACAGTAVWKIRIDHCGIDRRTSTNPHQMEAASRMLRTNMHGVKVGVAQKGANLKWFAGYDKHSYGLDWKGTVWTGGKQIINQLVDGSGPKNAVCFTAGDIVSVEVDFSSFTLRFAVNNQILPGAYYLSNMEPGVNAYVAVSLLWPGEEVSFISEELYE
mmetsp:Transcript_73025/g.152479  ORF Transcript_73025/g.152479 Transcript_73025/m.152479 type:complete len:283 (+) Transcript_73025:77-925(+)|eukprot:CAMPEP_0181341228 /NCGR_PEP_ID=MMETSP1101-20121128/30286_1 /TAXON_ID=46948 /ORGANISM="Rhodomonas abbreviata, Strain Caron Lab Isolate" /LENGTH=282 /DNA_ID=CAMNT_0023452467 /DNA_START=76 /DNA_END=924 /DNA_ORIENTATION=+